MKFLELMRLIEEYELKRQNFEAAIYYATLTAPLLLSLQLTDSS